MEDRKTRIAKLSERFKPHGNELKKPQRQRQRRSYYLDVDIMERLDREHKEFNHRAHPHTVGKSVFMEAILEYGMNNLPAVKALIEERSKAEPSSGE